MQANYPLLVILIGLVVRLALPVAITLVAVYLLQKLDAYWQKEAELQRSLAAQEEQPWDLTDCPIEKRSSQPVLSSILPCWQTHRLPNGYLNDDCLSCAVFTDAPAHVAHAHVHA